MATGDKEEVLATIRYGKDNEELRITRSVFNKVEYFGVRVWWLSEDGKWFPGKNGISIVEDRAVEVLTEALKHAKNGKKKAK